MAVMAKPKVKEWLCRRPRVLGAAPCRTPQMGQWMFVASSWGRNSNPQKSSLQLPTRTTVIHRETIPYTAPVASSSHRSTITLATRPPQLRCGSRVVAEVSAMVKAFGLILGAGVSWQRRKTSSTFGNPSALQGRHPRLYISRHLGWVC